MSKSIILKIIHKAFFVLPYLIMAIVTVPIFGVAITETSKLLGLKTIPVPVVGTGSMYPSLFWAKSEGGPEDNDKVVIEEYRSTPHLYKRYDGLNIFSKKYLKRLIGRGDMVAFKNDQTRAILKEEGRDTDAGFIKRVIGLPGDTLELRDGFTYLNGQLIAEPYIASPRSTYGSEYLKDCQKLVLTENHYFVMGDNRKVSSDSRYALGLVKLDDIGYVLPLQEQQIYHSLWRDTSKDDDLLGQPTLVSTEFINLVNDVRNTKKVSSLKSVPTLIKSSSYRGEKLLHSSNTSYGIKQAIKESGYSNIVLGEFVSHGHFSAKELIENLLYNSSTAKQILSPDYTDIGISTLNLEINGCPSQVIVGHLGGYVPANYDEKTIDSWKNLSQNISSVLPSWEGAVGHDQLDQVKLSSLLSIFYRKLELAKEIVTIMEQKKWLTDAQEDRIKADQSDTNQADQLVKELNKP